jgi:y4mF family transcriptional regulator
VLQYAMFPIGNSMSPIELGTIIRTTRLAQGLRQAQLAAAAGVGLRFLVELEAGKPTAQIGKTLAVLAALGCRVEVRPPGQGPSDT